MGINGAFAFGLVLGYLSWHTMRPGAPNANLNIKTLLGFVGVVGGAAVLALFPAGTDLFGAYAYGLAIGFFVSPLVKAFTDFIGKINKYTKSLEKETKSLDKETRRLERDRLDMVVASLPLVVLGISKMFKAQPTRTISAEQDLPEFPYIVRDKKYLFALLARQFPQYFSFDGTGLHIPPEAINPNNPLLGDTAKLYAFLENTHFMIDWDFSASVQEKKSQN